MSRLLKKEGHEIAGAIVLECVGYACATKGSQWEPPGVPIAVPTAGEFLAIVTNAASAALVAAVESAAKERVPDLEILGRA